ncbi:ABC transporter ATP-binding protein [Devosia sp. RR2S18]|uniref:dipeptide ABC transporter ATP-binding protein n=1 Tax=Devosia rhizosphaerae TaxID=3049774 RepID=UPI002540110B|nr:ABC transporter ATP-binding protein [Devosia sp. RR2S18]WIJ24510.1 ABC transporter ATP-binding protein [Devosia sp. RR2S18]
MDSLVAIRDLRISFAPSVEVVNGLDLDVSGGKTLCLVGESGCGKSVTAKSILQVIDHPGRVSGGSITLRQPDGAALDIASLKPTSSVMRQVRGADIAMIHQEPMSFLSPLCTIGNQISEALTLHRKIGAKQAREEAIRMLHQVGMPDPERRYDSYTFQLSGGQRQRAMIAMALINKPRLLIADEPTTALDVTTQANILDLLAQLQRETGMAILFITHALGVVAEIADEVAVMYLGRIVERGPVGEVLEHPKHPYTRGLLASMPRLEGDFKAPLRAIRGMVPPPALRPSGCSFHPRCDWARADLCPLVDLRETDLGHQHTVACHAYGPQALKFERTDPPVAVALATEPRRGREGPPLLSIRDLHKQFPVRAGFFQRRVGAVRAVDGVSLDIYPGETLGLVGESGCGKSTLGQTIVGLHQADAGSIAFADGARPPVDVLGARGAVASQMRTDIRMVFQDPTGSLNPRMRVRNIIGEVLQVSGRLREAEIEAKVQALLARVGLSPDYAERYPHAFSGGQRQRIAIARALASDPRLVIADEAVSALDVSVQTQIINMMKQLQAEMGLTYLFVSHDLGVIANISDRVAVMYAGRIVELAPTEAIFRDPRHPYTEALLAAIPGRRPRAEGARIRLGGHVPDAAEPIKGCAFADRCPYAISACRAVRPELEGPPEHLDACIRSEELRLRPVAPEAALVPA